MLLAEAMDMLTSGEYTLTKKNVVHERKSILFVKLTDSAQRALANYLCNLSSYPVPIIEFNNDEGRLQIPTTSASNSKSVSLLDTSEQCMAQFKFDVISNDTMQGKQGRFECVQHKRGTKQLVKYGQLTQRLRIHANEDVYETTKNRMAAIDQQQRKNCTVQLDWNSSTKTSSSVNRKLKLTHKGLPAANKNGDSVSETTSIAAATSTMKSVPRLETSNMIRNKSRPVNNAPPKKINPAAYIIRKPLKERIIHMLALRPYKRPELEGALKKDGLRDCDRSHFMDTLMSVSTFRDNTYHLSKHAWNDVQEDWFFYTDHERQLVKRNKQQNLTVPSSSSSDSGVSVSSNHSPSNGSSCNNSSNAGSPPQSYKRPGYFNGVDGFQTKRQRISHFVKQEPSSSSSSSSHNRGGGGGGFGIASGGSSTITTATSTIGNNSLLQNEDRSTDDSNMTASSSAAAATRYDGFKPSPPNARAANVERIPSYEKPKYMKDYVTISSTEQRSRYKTDFSKIFAEYKRVHKEVDQVRNLFAQLADSLRKHKKGSKGYMKVEHDIFKKYYALKNNHKFPDAKRRYEYLHEKLSHIKNLVNEYDDKVRKQMQ